MPTYFSLPPLPPLQAAVGPAGRTWISCPCPGHLLRVATLLALFAGWIGGEPARADVFVLVHGGRIEGELLNPDESPRASYLVQTAFGGRLTLDGEQVERVVVKSEAERRYEAFAAALPDNVEAHLDAAKRCDAAGLPAQRDFHYEQVLRLDPAHVAARRALGYSLLDGRWIRQEDLMASRGYVRHGGAWRLSQELELEKIAESQEQITGGWKKKLKLWSSWITKGRGKGAEGEAAIRGIRDPSAVPALAEQLQDAKEPRRLRLLYLEMLAGFGGQDAEAAFTRLAINDEDPVIRDRCLEVLTTWKSTYAVKAFIKFLEHDQNAIVHRAAIGLGRLKDPSATRPLINALITEHKQVVGGGGMTPTFSNQGSGLSMGGKPQVVKRKVQNEPVLSALTAMYPNVNFQFNQKAWLAWHAQRVTPPQIDLRRSE